MTKGFLRLSLPGNVTLIMLLNLLSELHRLHPGDTILALHGELSTLDNQEALEKALGLDQPLYVQYFAFLKRALSADFGVSTGVLPGRDAMELFLTRLLATVELSALALTLAVVVAIPLGYIAARRRGGPLDTAAIVSSLVGVAVPVFFLAFVLRHVFAIKMGLLPPSGRESVGINATRV